MFNLMIVLLATYLCYQRGAAYMFKSRIMDKAQAAGAGYAMFMLAGIILGEFTGLSFAYHYAAESVGWQLASGTICSILLGESFHYYNKRLIQKIPSMEQRKNY
ncbi:hypothetical protein BEP19_01835 [Ammoniphilus oxalaticus]|uniref:Uncharacterized protein n=1 Tax=Ammoniphilus oxalaticus TaxID=66863 RepID=A0A419SN24_9BACL|nr:hypothetical protein [Ammoniphilus oxalaticus]RKD25706.1 hypothetical protein BEP19_01835 [Ammoniphilus oxalaticus]